MKLHLLFESILPTEQELAVEQLVGQVATKVKQATSQDIVKEFNVIVTGDGLMQQLNNDYRKTNRVTDVLSFPMDEGEINGEIDGEIYIAWSRVQSQAIEFGHSWQREFSYLLVHGILHLLGYQHGDEPCLQMRAKEEEVMTRMGLGRD